MKRTIRTLTAAVSLLAVGALTLLWTAQGTAQTLEGRALVEALEQGGYVLVMRHGSTTTEAAGPRRGPADAPVEPRLDEQAVGLVTGMRFAFRELAIPVGDVLVSPTLRTRQHAEQFGFGEPVIVDELGTEDMAPDADRSAWLRAKAAEAPSSGTNTVIVTHGPNIAGAFDVGEIGLGETLVIRPDGESAAVVARVPIEEWARLALS